MTGGDLEYFKLCNESGLVQAPFLEVGSAKVQPNHPNLCELARHYGLSPVSGTDLQQDDGVDFVSDFALEKNEFINQWNHGTFNTVAIFNVLEHTYDPILVLSNILSITRPGGCILMVTPVVWPIHSFPNDFSRLLPDWYLEFANRNHIHMVYEKFCWISQFGVHPLVRKASSAEYEIPNFHNQGLHQTAKYWISRIVHKMFNTYGRSHVFTHTAIGAAMLLPKIQTDQYR